MKRDLSKGEVEVMNLLITGMRLNEIAKKLFRSPATVATIIGRVRVKLGVHSTLHAAILWSQRINGAEAEYRSWGKGG